MFLQPAKQFSAEPVKAAVGHHEDEIAAPRFSGEIFRNLLGGIKSLRRSPCAADRFKNTSRRHPLFIAQKICPIHRAKDGPIR